MEKKSVLYMALRRSWWYGFAFSTGFSMLIQDYMGLERYIVYLREHWVNLPWVVGLLIAACGLFFHTALLARFAWLNETEKEEEHG
jgi:hypothetical protein